MAITKSYRVDASLGFTDAPRGLLSVGEFLVMAFFALTDFAGALLLPRVLALAVDAGLAADVGAFATLALVVALPATCWPFEATAGLAFGLGLAADVDAFATLALTLALVLALVLVVALPATCRPFKAPVGLTAGLGLALVVGLAADVDVFKALALAVVVVLPATC